MGEKGQPYNFLGYHPSHEPAQDDKGGGTHVCTRLLSKWYNILTSETEWGIMGALNKIVMSQQGGRKR